jgi:hypothetical protein
MRPILFSEFCALEHEVLDPLLPCTFGGQRGWLISDVQTARRLLTSTVGRKARPTHSQRMLGGVGVLEGAAVRSTKRELIMALDQAARGRPGVAEHLRAALGQWARSPSLPGLTEAFSSSMLTAFAGLPPGSVDGCQLRELVLATWGRLEQSAPISSRARSGVQDALHEFMLGFVSPSQAPAVDFVRRAGWADTRIAEELRAMVLPDGAVPLLPP